MNVLEAAWLGGLLEGEGTFYIRTYRRGNSRPRIVVALEMTDEDVVLRAAGLMGSKVGGPYLKANKPQCLGSWKSSISGAGAARVMQAVLPFMGERRAAKIRDCLATPNLSHT